MIAVVSTSPKAYVDGYCVLGARVEGAVYEQGLEASRLCVDRRRADLGPEDGQCLWGGLYLGSHPYLRARGRIPFLPTQALEAFCYLLCLSKPCAPNKTSF